MGKYDFDEEGFREVVMNDGREEGILTAIKNRMKNMSWTEEQAMKALGISEAEQEKYRSLL